MILRKCIRLQDSHGSAAFASMLSAASKVHPCTFVPEILALSSIMYGMKKDGAKPGICVSKCDRGIVPLSQHPVTLIDLKPAEMI